MKAFIAILLLSITLVSAFAPLHRNGEAIDGQFIVVLNPLLSQEEVSTHIARVQNTITTLEDNSTIFQTFSIGTFNGYAARFSHGALFRERQSHEVAYVEHDQIARLEEKCVDQQTTEWGLDRISERDLNLDGIYHYPTSAGQGVDAYVVDTGVRITHNEFNNGGVKRATWGTNTVGDGRNEDCNGHGTHVAGTIAGDKYGVAKVTSIIAVKVLGCGGSGTYAGVIAGVDYVAQQAGRTKKPSVANLSLGGGKSQALEEAIKQGTGAGVTYVLAAGNENRDACIGSPSGVGGTNGPAITVGATTVEDDGQEEEDVRASFSNFGLCTDIFAPGQLITSAWSDSDTSTRTISGTSMAAPHVCGVAALYLGQNPTARPADLKRALPLNASPNYIDLNCQFSSNPASCGQSPNKMLYSDCDQ